MRNPFIPLRIAEIKNSTYYAGNKENKLPSFIVTKLGEKVIRAGIVGTVVDKYVNDEMTYCRLIVNDETDDIVVKAFRDLVNEAVKIDIGNIVFVVGKIRESNYRYINAELIKKVDFKFEAFFKLKVIERIKRNSYKVEEILKLSNILSYSELLEEAKKRFEMDEIEVSEVLKNKGIENLEDNVLKIIENFSSEEGISLSEILSLVNIDKEKLTQIIDSLLESGKIYEYKPGKYKIIK
ncbi:MAG: hypothetical protein QXP34_00690 [Candidatus Aenigmatarchaeota archaeon]